MPRRRRVAACGGALLLGLVTAACGSSASAPSPATPATTAPSRSVTLWVDLPLAGAAAQEGRQMLDAVRLVVSQAGYRVGKLGVDVRASDDADLGDGSLRPGALPCGCCPRRRRSDGDRGDRNVRVVVHDARAPGSDICRSRARLPGEPRPGARDPGHGQRRSARPARALRIPCRGPPQPSRRERSAPTGCTSWRVARLGRSGSSRRSPMPPARAS